jgi:hypothetical protein
MKFAQRLSRKTFTTSGAETAYPSEAPEFSPGISWGLSFCPFLFAIVCPTSIYAS